MDVELETLMQQKKELERYADELLEVRYRLLCHKRHLNHSWNAREVDGMNEALDRLDMEIRRITEEMYRIGRDMIMAYQEAAEEEMASEEGLPSESV